MTGKIHLVNLNLNLDFLISQRLLRVFPNSPLSEFVDKL